MKLKVTTLIALGATLFMSCNQKEIEDLSKKNEQLSETALQKEATINDMLASFNEIQANLKEIKSREGIIEITTEEGASAESISDQINDDIQTISDLMQQNEALMDKLNQKLANSNIELSEFKKLVANLNTQIGDKNAEIAKLNQSLQDKKVLIGQLYFKNDSLTYNNKLKDAKIQQKIDQLNEGFFAYGTFKELKEKNILTKEGGFLGLGKNEELKDDFNKEYFSRIDIRKQKSFLIYADKAELITKHPKNSYQFMGDGKVDSLVITDVDRFWNASKYLVIVVD